MREKIEKADAPIHYNFKLTLPPYAPAGQYKIHIRAHDALKNTDSELLQSFTVEAPPIAPSTKLEFRDFHFSLSEGGSPVIDPVIQAGGTIYSTCKVFGMEFREDCPDVRISLKVLGPKGEMVIDKSNFVTLNDPVFYRPQTFFVELSGWATLPSKAPKGRYTWKYTLTDRIANKKTDYEATFEVR